MGRSDKSDFRDWEEQAAIKEGQKIDQGTQAAIEELAKNAKKLESTVRAALQ